MDRPRYDTTRFYDPAAHSNEESRFHPWTTGHGSANAKRGNNNLCRCFSDIRYPDIVDTGSRKGGIEKAEDHHRDSNAGLVNHTRYIQRIARKCLDVLSAGARILGTLFECLLSSERYRSWPDYCNVDLVKNESAYKALRAGTPFHTGQETSNP